MAGQRRPINEIAKLTVIGLHGFGAGPADQGKRSGVAGFHGDPMLTGPPGPIRLRATGLSTTGRQRAIRSVCRFSKSGKPDESTRWTVTAGGSGCGSFGLNEYQRLFMIELAFIWGALFPTWSGTQRSVVRRVVLHGARSQTCIAALDTIRVFG
jgi:hypothetical protein